MARPQKYNKDEVHPYKMNKIKKTLWSFFIELSFSVGAVKKKNFENQNGHPNFAHDRKTGDGAKKNKSQN